VFQIDGRDDEQTIETRIGLRKAFGPVVVPESSLSRSRDVFERARDSHYLVPAGTPQQFRNDGSAQMTAGAAHTDFHVNLQYFSNEQIVREHRSAADGLLVGKFRPLQNHGCFLKIEPRIAWVELARVSIAQVTEKIDLPLTVGKECRIQFICVEAGHRSAI
jgi:hypothetical protein